MKPIVTLPRNKFDQRSHPRPGTGQKLTIHYILNGHVLCQTESRLTADTRFLEIPIPVRHRMMMGATK